MAATNLYGPQFIMGPCAAIPSSFGGGGAPDPNSDAGPGGVFQGTAIIDPRVVFPKDNTTGVRASVMAHLPLSFLKSVAQIPATLAANNICTAQAVTDDTAMTFTTASTGIDVNIPIVPFSQAYNSEAAVTTSVVLDFGFAFGNVTSGSTSIVVSSSELFWVGMPLVIARVGNSGGTAPLLTYVVSITDSTHIVVADEPLATHATAAIGTGNLWGPNTSGYPTPTAAFPFLSRGPSVVLDPRQGVARGIRIVGAGGSTGGDFLVEGYDIYGMAMSELVTVAAASTGYSLKTFKYLETITPQFTDAATYTVGTADLFGFAYRSRVWEDTRVFWNGAAMTSATGWVAADTTDPATTTTNDVRGTIQTGASGPGSGIGANASNGTISSLAMSGRRLEIGQFLTQADLMRAFPGDTVSMFGVEQA